MNFNNERSLTINRDRLATPVCDRWLPNHPKERYGKLPYWYYRTRFVQYGTSLYDLPFRNLRRYPEPNEQMWFKVSQRVQQEKLFFVGAILPYHDIFFEAGSLEVIGDRINTNQPVGFVYV